MDTRILISAAALVAGLSMTIGSAKDGKVTAFIPEPSAEIQAPEGVGVDDAGNVYGGWTGKMTLRRFTKS